MKYQFALAVAASSIVPSGCATIRFDVEPPLPEAMPSTWSTLHAGIYHSPEFSTQVATRDSGDMRFVANLGVGNVRLFDQMVGRLFESQSRRRHGRRGLFFAGPSVGRVGYQAHYSETDHACRGAPSTRQESVDGRVSLHGVSVGYAWQFSCGQLLVESGVADVTDGPVESTMLMLNIGGDFFFGPTVKKS